MYEHLLLLVTVLQGLTLLKVLRRGEGEQRAYALVVGGVAVLAVLALARTDRFIGSVAVGLSFLTVVMPWALESVSRWAFGRGRLSLAVRAAGVRGMLMPGAGLGRQQQILHGIGLLEREGVDAALDYFRGLAHATEDGGELALIHEQIVSMLFYGQRWDEGIAHYERRFHPGYAAMRPGLALGLLRAYGESRRIDNAAGLLRALEEGPVGADPRSAEMMGQARVTFLAYAGAAGVLDEVVTQDRVEELGMSPATGALFHGIALARAGDPERAEAALRRVESLAGPKDQRVIDASRSCLGRVMGAAVELEPELISYVQSVSTRLRGFLRAPPMTRRRNPPWATFGIMIAFAFTYGVGLLRAAGGIGLLELGALTPELWNGGAWHRLLTAPWLHADVITLMFDVYAIWLAGHILEQVYGSARMAIIAIGGAVAGLLAGLFITPYPMMVMAAGNLMAVAVIVGALWTLLPTRSPGLAPRSRRTLGMTLVLLLVANMLASIPAFLGLDYPPIALIAAGVWGTVWSLALPVSLPSLARKAMGVVVIGALLVSAYAGGSLLGEDPEASLVSARSQVCTFAGIDLRVPGTLEWTQPEVAAAGFSVPTSEALTDMLALRAGDLVQVLVVAGAGSDEGPALFDAHPQWGRQLGTTARTSPPEGWPAAILDEGWRAWDLRRNGEVVGQLVERSVAGAPEPTTVVLVGSPSGAVSHTPRLYTAILGEAVPNAEAGGNRCVHED